MANLNKVILVGHVGKDPEITHFEKGASVTRFSLATSENYKDKSEEWQTRTEWHNIVCWRSLGERAEKQIQKGDMVYVEGKIRNRTYTDKDNIKRYQTDIEATTFSIFVHKELQGNNPNPEPSNNFSNGDQSPSPEVLGDKGDGLPF
jgi:single-strand DNA-binding protein